MICLIEYNRKEGRMVDLVQFDDSESTKACAARLARELKLYSEGIDHEVLLLQGESIEALKKSHGRYFYTLREMLDSAREFVKNRT